MIQANQLGFPLVYPPSPVGIPSSNLLLGREDSEKALRFPSVSVGQDCFAWCSS